MTPFLQSVSHYIFHHYRDELKDLALVFPNKRARLFFNQYISKLTDKPVFAPKYYTIAEYMQQLSGATLADQLTLLFTLYEVFVSVTKSKESFDQFLFYCEMLLADFDDIDKYFADAEMIYRNLSDLKELEAYYDYLDEAQIKAIEQFWKTFAESKDSEQKEGFSQLWNMLFKIYSAFKSRLREMGLSYEGMAFRDTIDLVQKNTISWKHKKVVFVGFNALNTCEVMLFKALKKAGKALFFWDYDSYYMKREMHEAAYFLKDHIRQFPAPDDFTFSTNLISKDKTIKIFDIATTTGQAKALPLVFGNLPKEWQKNQVNSAIALADEALLMPTLNALPEDIEKVNISMGYPLKETKVYGLTCLLLELHKNKRTGKNDSFYHIDVLNILNNGLFSRFEALSAEIIQKAIKYNMVYLNGDMLSETGTFYAQLFQSGVSPQNFIKYLKSILQQVPAFLAKEVKNTWLIEREATLRILNQLNKIGDIIHKTSIKFNFSSLTRLLAKLLENTSIPFSGEPLEGIQIMGVLETRNIDFENLIIVSMNEGIFPKSGNVPSFVPYALRKGFGLPTIEHQDAIFAYYFYRLLQRASNIMLIYSSSVNDTISGEPSRFIHQLLYEPAFEPIKQTLSYQVNPLPERTVFIKKSPKTREILLKKYQTTGNKALSPSAINTYLNCPARFYFKYVAELKEPENVLEEIEATLMGSILHKAMEYLYKPCLNKEINTQIIEGILENTEFINTCIHKAFLSEYLEPNQKEQNPSNVKLIGKNKLIKEVIFKYVKSVLEFDKRHTPFTFLGLEMPCRMVVKISGNKQISIGGIIDRVDNAKGTTRIIDYKTGIKKDSFNDLVELFTGKATKRNGAAFQTLLYASVLSNETENQHIFPGLYYVRNLRAELVNESLSMGTGKRKTRLDSYSQVKEEFEYLLFERIDEIFSDNGVFKQTDDTDYCTQCPYTSICGKFN
jgi:CRISPR/Cas system-associated exonuclease Cas4 (RecB family)